MDEYFSLMSKREGGKFQSILPEGIASVVLGSETFALFQPQRLIIAGASQSHRIYKKPFSAFYCTAKCSNEFLLAQ